MLYSKMELKDLITKNRKELLKAVLKLHNKSEEDLHQDIAAVRAWLSKQQHLPEIPSKLNRCNKLNMV